MWTGIARQLDIPWQVAEVEIARLVRNDSCLRSEPLSSNTPEVSHSGGEAPWPLPAFQPLPPLRQHPSQFQEQIRLPSFKELTSGVPEPHMYESGLIPPRTFCQANQVLVHSNW
jgi:hypothetical protein